MIGIIHVTDGPVSDLEEWTTQHVNTLRGGMDFDQCNAVLSVAGASWDGFRIECLAGSLNGDTAHTVPNEIMMIFRGEPFTRINMDLVDQDRYTQIVLHTLSTADFPQLALSEVAVGVNHELQCLVAIVQSGGNIGQKMMECDYIHELPLTPRPVLH